MNNVHEDAPVIFQTRWTLSFLRGPLTKKQIQVLMASRKATAAAAASVPTVVAMAAGSGARSPVPAGVRESFVPWRGSAAPGERLVYRGSLLGSAKVHFVDAKAQVDVWSDVALLHPLADDDVSWDAAEDLGARPDLESAPDPKGSFEPLPAVASQAKNYGAWSKLLEEALYRTRTLDLFSAPSLKVIARPGESEGDFRIRVKQAVREKRDAAVDALRAKYATKLDTLRNQEQRAAGRVEREQAQASQQTMQTAISLGATVLGALFGRKALSVGNIGRATTAARGVGRTLKERQDIEGAAQSVEALRAKRAELETELQSEIQELTDAHDPDGVPVLTASLKPRKSDITVDGVALVWLPWFVGGGGSARPAR